MLLLWCALTAQVATAAPAITFSGNVILPDDLYLTVLRSVPEPELHTVSSTTAHSSTTARGRTTLNHVHTSSLSALSPAQRFAAGDPEAADLVKDRLLKFLRISGYTLARVRVFDTPKGLHVDIDEGRLDKVLFLRQGTLANIELRFLVALPFNVFNQPLLERKLAELVRQTSVTKAEYEIVKVADVEHKGVQVVEPQLIRGLRFLDQPEDYELHIRLTRATKQAGWDLKLGYRGADGLFGGFGYKVGGVLLDNDRIETEATGGFYIGDTIDSNQNPLGISRLHGRLRWLAPPMFSEVVRAFIEGEFDLWGRRRNDLRLFNYFYAPISGTLNFEVSLGEGVKMSVGGGVEHRLLFGVDAGEEDVPVLAITPTEDTRFLMALEAEYQFNPAELRLDRKHVVWLSGSYRGRLESTSGSPITRAALGYRKYWDNGWDEVRFGVYGAHIWGDVPFYDEMSIGDGFLRAGFHTQVYVQRAAALSLEYRLSLSRDTLKVSVFNDFAVYGARDELRRKAGTRLADIFGGGLHVLLIDTFQVNAYLGVAVDQNLGLGLGFKAQLTKAF